MTNRSGRGNIFLESALPLAKSLHHDIVALGKRIERAAFAEEDSRRKGTTARTGEAHHVELHGIIREIRTLLAQIDKDIPTLQLAISSSGETLNASLPSGISPSRLLQASFFVNMGDTQFGYDPSHEVQIGPPFYLSLYMLFVGHSSGASRQSGGQAAGPATPGPSQAGTPLRDEPYGFGPGERRPIWQEVLHKARVRLCRTPVGWQFDHNLGYVPPVDASLGTAQGSSSKAEFILGRPDEYAYHLEIVEDLDDDRVHDEEDRKARPYGNVPKAGIRESIPIPQIAKIFYTDSGRILNIGNADEAGNNPILLLKRDANAGPEEDLTADVETPSRQPFANVIEEASSETFDDQNEIDRQIREESGLPEDRVSRVEPHPLALHLPSHLDPEWLAFEVFEGDGYDGEECSDSEDEKARHPPKSTQPSHSSRRTAPLDANLLTQLKNLSTTDITASTSTASKEVIEQPIATPRDDNVVARGTFGGITSSLSLMEMLIRLTSLQEFQQTSHLSVPDYITSFFLEETSNTGLKGEERWRARDEATRRVGFDPYTDTPTK